jgi:hypothetical protein
MAGLGHEDQFAPVRVSGRCRFDQATFIGTHENERDAPIPAIRDCAIGSRRKAVIRSGEAAPFWRPAADQGTYSILCLRMAPMMRVNPDHAEKRF